MLRFQRALVAELLVVFVLVLGVVTTIIFFGTTVQLVAKGGEGAGSRLLIELVPYLLPMALCYGLPFSWLTAVALVVGRMVNDHEITALRSAGVHMRAVAAPVAALGALLAVGGMAASVYWAPESQREINGSMREYLRFFLAALQDVDRSVSLGNGRFSWSAYDPKAEEFLGVELDRRDAGGAIELKVIARRLKMQQITEREDGAGLDFQFTDAFILGGGTAGLEDARRQEKASVSMSHVERIGTSVAFSPLFAGKPFRLRPKDMTLPELTYARARGGVLTGTVADVDAALHGRLALGSGPFFMGLFALAMSLALPPTGRRVRDFLASFLPAVFVFFPLFLSGASLAAPTGLPIWATLWVANLLLALSAGVMFAVAFRR
jgi:lipopolysaccharide export LptBFGC system permease protein LptF